MTLDPGEQREPTDPQPDENQQLRELVDLQDARIKMLELELLELRNHQDPTAVRIVAWKLVHENRVELDDNTTHIRVIMEHTSGLRYTHDHVTHGAGPGMTGVTTIAPYP